MHLTDTERITVLMMKRYGDKIRSYQEVADLFNATYPDRGPILSQLSKKLLVVAPRSGKPKNASNDKKILSVLLTIYDNPQERESSRK